MTIRVFVVDDHPLIRDGLRLGSTRTEDIQIVAEASDAASALANISDVHPDVTVLDQNLPDRTGIEILPELLAASPDTRVLMVTGDDAAQCAKAALAAGASGFVGKAAGIIEICTGIRVVAAGRLFLNTVLPPQAGQLVPDQLPTTTIKQDLTAVLSPREREVLTGLAQGMTNQQIADQLFLSVKSIETYRARLQSKLNVKNRAGLTTLALEHGLLNTPSVGSAAHP